MARGDPACTKPSQRSGYRFLAIGIAFLAPCMCLWLAAGLGTCTREVRFPLKAAGLAATAARDPSREVMAAAFAILLCHYGELAADRRAIRNIISRVAKLGSSQDSGQISSHPQSCQGTQAHSRCGCATRQSRQGGD